MSKRMWSDKQLEFLLTDDRRINILSGSVRSGKTWISLLKFALTVAASPEKHEFLMVGKTITALKRNCLGLLQDLIGDNLRYSLSQKQGEIFGHRIYFEGASDDRAESKIRGMTLGGAYVDELTQIPEAFYKMLLSRLSLAGAKLYATTNPDNPTHYVKKDIIDNEKIDAAVWHFVIDDNVFLDPEYVKQIKNEYTGVFYDRMILGRWVVAEGLIYSMFNNDFHVVPSIARPYERYRISCDYGTVNPTSMGLWGLANKKWYRIREYYFDSRKEKHQKTDEEHYIQLDLLAGDLKIEQVIVDPSAASFIEVIRRHGKYLVTPASNRVIDGIREVATHLRAGDLFISDDCRDCIREFGLYRWDEKANEDKPLKTDDHSMDDLRYFVRSAFRSGLIEF